MENKITLNTEVIQRVSRRNGFRFGYIDKQTTTPVISDDIALLLQEFIYPKEGQVLVCLECNKSEFRFDGYNQITTTKREVVANYIGDGQWEVTEEILLNKFI